MIELLQIMELLQMMELLQIIELLQMMESPQTVLFRLLLQIMELASAELPIGARLLQMIELA